MVGYQQANIDQCMPDLVDVTGGWQTTRQTIVFAKVLKFINQVKKEKQRQKAHGNQCNGDQYLAVNQAANGFHAAALLRGVRGRKAARSVQLALRLASHSNPSVSTPPCNSSIKPPKLMAPPKTQLCPKFTKLL